MRAFEFITEAHHHIYKVVQVGPWAVHFDSHAEASRIDRQVSQHDVNNILIHACNQPETLSTIPQGRGAYYQDVNTRVSLYLHRLGPDSIRFETVLDASLTPNPPMFRRAVPPHGQKPSVKSRNMDAALRDYTQKKGRDALSQAMQNTQDAPPLNREQRRMLDKKFRLNKPRE